jgi:hypothetical protein
MWKIISDLSFKMQELYQSKLFLNIQLQTLFTCFFIIVSVKPFYKSWTWRF